MVQLCKHLICYSYTSLESIFYFYPPMALIKCGVRSKSWLTCIYPENSRDKNPRPDFLSLSFSSYLNLSGYPCFWTMCETCRKLIHNQENSSHVGMTISLSINQLFAFIYPKVTRNADCFGAWNFTGHIEYY